MSFIQPALLKISHLCINKIKLEIRKKSWFSLHHVNWRIFLQSAVAASLHPCAWTFESHSIITSFLNNHPMIFSSAILNWRSLNPSQKPTVILLYSHRMQWAVVLILVFELQLLINLRNNFLRIQAASVYFIQFH